MKEYTITISENPVPALRPKVSGKCRWYKEPYKSYKKLLESKVYDSVLGNKSLLFERYEPISIQIVYEMPIPSSLSKKKKNNIVGMYHTKKPDLDNLDKAILDSLSGQVFYDDGQVVSLSSTKKYSNEPKTIVVIRSLDG